MLAIRPEELECLPLFPLPELVFFPHTVLPLHIFEPRYRKMTADVLSGGLPLAVVMAREGSSSLSDRPPVHQVAGVGRVIEHRQLQDGRYYILLAGLGRVRIREELETTQPYRLVSAELLEERASDIIQNHPESALLTLKGFVFSLARKHPPVAAVLTDILKATQDPSTVSDVLAATVVTDPKERQRLLETLDIDERLSAVTAVVASLAAETVDDGGNGALLN